MKRIILLLIRVYQYLFSYGILKTVSLVGVCRFQPTCSEYAYQAIDKYGTIKGSFLGLQRILRCRPFCCGGYDPVKENV